MFLECGYRVVVVVARGCGNLRLTTADGLLGSRTSDLREAVSYVSSRYPQSKLFCIGFSLGAAITIKYLTEDNHSECNEKHHNANTIVTAAVCVSPPWDYHLTTPIFPLWSLILAVPLKLYALRHLAELNSGVADRSRRVSPLRILLCRSLLDVDKLIVGSGRYGYKSVEEYWTDCSPAAALQAGHISVPTLAISAMDDPVCCHRGAPFEYHTPADRRASRQTTAELNSALGSGSRGGAASHLLSPAAGHCEPRQSNNLVVLKTRVGGHLAFATSPQTIASSHNGREYRFEPPAHFPACWADGVALQWFDSFLNDNDNDKKVITESVEHSVSSDNRHVTSQPMAAL
jgi:predicted alpha/beta-fold hydrolase